jgi:uncharacterized protein YciI
MMHLVTLLRDGPRWQADRVMEEQSDWHAHAEFMDELVREGQVVLGGPLRDQRRVVLAMDGESEAAVRDLLARDPWAGSHLVVASVEPWTIRLDGRRT